MQMFHGLMTVYGSGVVHTTAYAVVAQKFSQVLSSLCTNHVDVEDMPTFFWDLWQDYIAQSL